MEIVPGGLAHALIHSENDFPGISFPVTCSCIQVAITRQEVQTHLASYCALHNGIKKLVPDHLAA